MVRFRSNKGFTLIGILIAVVIVCILSMGGLQVYTGAGGKKNDYKPDTIKGGLNMVQLKGVLSNLAMAQVQEYSLRQEYIPHLGTLIERAYGKGYGANATDRAALIPMFDIKMEFTPSGFVIKAVPAKLEGAPKDSPTYVVDQTLNIREE